jgi:hypothetical protein
MIYCRPVLLKAFNSKDASYLDQWDRCGCPFEHNLAHRGWSFVMAALKPFSRFITEWHFVLMVATAEIQSRTGRVLWKEGWCWKLSCWGEEPPHPRLPQCAPKLLCVTFLKTELLDHGTSQICLLSTLTYKQNVHCENVQHVQDFLLLISVPLILKRLKHKPRFLLTGNKNCSQIGAPDTVHCALRNSALVCFSMDESLCSSQFCSY